ncbi:MAG: lycopene cyclase family protein [Candidatus Kariarchaeaceae archaeon]|jgi:lycopene beta-cyclase
MDRYDYAIIGGGMSGLSLARELINQGVTASKTLVVLEKRIEYSQDKVWSFWNIKQEDYSSITLGSWDQIVVRNREEEILVNNPVPYLSINSQLYYEEILEVIENDPNSTLLTGSDVVSTTISDDGVHLILSDSSIIAEQVFDSRIPQNVQNKPYDLLQHFEGWEIRVEDPVFDPTIATLMDFEMNQQWGLHFMYILPISTTQAVFEATWFSDRVLEPEIYKRQLTSYLSSYLDGIEYSVEYVERGIIPMSTSIPEQKSWKPILPIGTAGGLTRPSTGYTFLSAQWYSKQLAHNLIEGRRVVPTIHGRWTAYLDETLLRVLSKHPERGPKIFVKMFKRNTASRIIKFLSGTSQLNDEVVIMLKVPYLFAFTSAAFKGLLSRILRR